MEYIGKSSSNDIVAKCADIVIQLYVSERPAIAPSTPYAHMR